MTRKKKKILSVPDNTKQRHLSDRKSLNYAWDKSWNDPAGERKISIQHVMESKETQSLMHMHAAHVSTHAPVHLNIL